MGGAAGPLPGVPPPDLAAVCVTGATGYIGSWLVRSLLRRGYPVHAASRDLRKAEQLRDSAWGGAASQRLKLFRAIMEEEGSYDEAVEGCVCVFHVAASMQFSVPPDAADQDGYVRRQVLQPAVEGTLNVMLSCRRADSVKRVVLTSSISTATARNSSGGWNPLVDESSLVSVDSIWKEKPPGWAYALSKVMTEEAALRFAGESGMELVAVVPTTVAGPFLTPEVPVSLRVLLSPITKEPLLYPILLAVNSRMGSISLVHIEDLVEAQIFLMEAAVAEGRYICSGGSCSMDTLAELLSSEYPPRLTELGFRFTHGVKEVVRETVACCVRVGFLRNPEAVCSSSSQE
ncbi:unnamed protein product [Spirodela intermedia]|uniref:NAD-dependent epimerase/dehydratase domain-containing protein n=1 Tax=Spirodela intermedia TaxID=51605 RepID=A0A7I8KBT4_SPIIN|nr:unnamed protein product [Spirodela intermedia]